MNYSLKSFRGDFFGGVTTTVVVLPVALAFGVASGMGAAAGIYGAVAVGLFASVFGSAQSRIPGPTTATTVAMAVIVTSYASTMSEALTIVILGGLFQVLLGLSRIGRFVAYTPHVVVSGFMSGIGIIVIVMQTLPVLGIPSAPGGVLGAIRAYPDAAGNVNTSALAVAAFTLGVASAWPRGLARQAPAPLIALLAGTALSLLWLNDVPVIGPVPAALPELQLEAPSLLFLLRAVEPALIFALIGSVNSLLISLVADSLTGSRHDPNRELVGQGVGTLAAGAIGGLPGAGSTMLTMTNIRAGGRTRISGVVYALLLLVLAFGLGRFVEVIPHAVLAGILIKIGWDNIDWRLLTRIHRIQREYAVVMLATLVLTVFVDLITGVAIGLIAAGMAHARQLEGLELDSVISVPLVDRVFLARAEDAAADPYAARVGLVRLKGRFTVASSHKLIAVIGADIKDHEVVIFDFSGATHLDDSAAMVIDRLMEIAADERTEVIVMGLSSGVAHILHTLGVRQRIPDERLVETLEEAREASSQLLKR
ncbi:MAG: SulP family inorganic anion transporter [Gammaproteobacteria bacterium]|nr:SulP family inorganic anion transporter [Gammaproteobacteria bacterium]MDE0365300.1 SulP family inorganic anion transporter [Gammaproteobacteria bacterium]